MVGVSASVNLPLHHKVQKFSSGTGSPGWSWKKGRKTVVVWCDGGGVDDPMARGTFGDVWPMEKNTVKYRILRLGKKASCAIPYGQILTIIYTS